MNPLLEINPAACLFVMGPQLSHKVGRNNSTRSNTAGGAELTDQVPLKLALPASYNSILDAGLSFLNSKLSDEEESSVELAQLKRVITSEEGQTKATVMERLIRLMKKANCYDEWLKNSFGGAAEKHQSFINSSVDKGDLQCTATLTNATDQSMEIGSIQHLLSLQRQGALLACTQYDTILDSIAGTRPLTLHNTETLKQWSKLSTLPETISLQDSTQCKQHMNQHLHPVGILHLHGVCTDPSSIRFTDYHGSREEEEEKESVVELSTRGRKPIPAPEDFESIVPPGMDILREIFRKRLVIFVGYDRDYFDPLLPGLLQKLYPDNEPGSLKNPPILLTSMPLMRQLSIGKQLPSTFLTLMVSEEELHNLSHVISPGSPKNFTVGKGLTDKQSSDGLKVQAFLLFNEKQSFRKLGDVIYHQSKSGEIYVRRDALTVIFDDNKILYGNLVTYGGNGLRQLWRLVFSEGSTLLGKGLMALGLQNAAIIWTNRKPAELGNVTGINSVHTYAAHKAVHTMALAQQQYSSSNSIVQSATLSSTIPMENNTTTSHRTAVKSHSQKLSSQSNPMLQQVATGPLASPSKDSEDRNEGRGGRDKESEQRERGRRMRGGEKEERESMSSAATMVNSSSSDSNLIKQQAAALSSLTTEKGQPVGTAESSQATFAASIPRNFLLPGAAALTSSPMTSSAMALNLGGLNLSALHTPLTVAAMSNQLLAGLPAAAITPTGITTPTGLLSPVLLGNNPFLGVLGSSPAASLSPAVVQASQPAATVHQPTAVAAGATSLNLQVITQLQEKINAHLQRTTSTQQGDIGSMVAAAGGPGRMLQQALSASGLDQELSQRNRLLESLSMSKTPVYCIASAPEVLVSDSLSSEHIIEYIDTLRKPSSSRDSNEVDGKCLQDTQMNVGNSNLSEGETAKDGGVSESSRAGQSLLELISSKNAEAKLSTSLTKDQTGSTSNNTTSSPLRTIAHSSLSSTIPTPSQAATSRTPLALNRMSLTSTAIPSPSPLFTSSLATSNQQQKQALPLLSYAAVPPTTTAALSPLTSPPNSYYIMLNPALATAAAATTGTAVSGAAAAVQPLMIAAAAAPGAAANPTAIHGTGAAAVHVPLTAATGLNLPLLATTTLNSVPSPMYYYMPALAPAVNSAATLATTIGGRVEVKERELESKLRSHDLLTSLPIAKANKKRLRNNDPTGLSEAKRIRRMDTEGMQVDSEEEGGPVDCVTASESDDEVPDKIAVHNGENYKSSGYKGHLQLWEFLLDLLLTPNHGSIIQWTGNEYEFNIVNPEAVVRLWGAHKHKPQMTYDKMSRSLRYYYSQGIMDKVPGKRYTFKFAFDIQKYLIDNKKTSLFTLTS